MTRPAAAAAAVAAAVAAHNPPSHNTSIAVSCYCCRIQVAVIVIGAVAGAELVEQTDRGD